MATHNRSVQDMAADVDRWMQKVRKICGGSGSGSGGSGAGVEMSGADGAAAAAARSAKRRKVGDEADVDASTAAEEMESKTAIASTTTEQQAQHQHVALVPLSHIDKLIAQAKSFGINLNREIESLQQVSLIFKTCAMLLVHKLTSLLFLTIGERQSGGVGERRLEVLLYSLCRRHEGPVL